MDMKGHRFALGDRISTKGYLVSRVILKEHGLAVPYFRGVTNMRSHAKRAEIIINGEAAVVDFINVGNK